MGTPDFAVPILETLIEHTDVVMVVTQPDKEVGRHHELVPTPIKKVRRLRIPWQYGPRRLAGVTTACP